SRCAAPPRRTWRKSPRRRWPKTSTPPSTADPALFARRFPARRRSGGFEGPKYGDRAMKRFALLVILGVLLAACAGAGDVAETIAPVTATTEPSPGTTAAVTPPTVPDTTSSVTEVEAWQPREHWVGVEGDRFVDNRRGETFVPRGVNLLHKFVGGHVDG